MSNKNGHLYFDYMLKDYLEEVRNYPILSEEEEYNYGIENMKGNMVARKKLIESNLMYVVSIAMEISGSFGYLTHLKIMDLIQEGNIGLIKAVANYDPKKGRVTTYATKKIKRCIYMAISGKESALSVPNRVVENTSKYVQMLNFLDEEELSKVEICERLNLSEVDFEKVETNLHLRITSLDVPLVKVETNSSDKSAILSDIISDENNNINEFMSNLSYYEYIVAIKSLLSPLEYYIFYLKCVSDNELTLAEIGKTLYVSGESIRQKEKSLKNKMKLYFKDNFAMLKSILSRIQLLEGNKFYNLKTEPITPDNILVYLFLKDELSDVEQQLLYLVSFGKYNYSIFALSKIVNVDVESLEELLNSLYGRINEALISSEYKKFKMDLLTSNKTRIYDFLKKDFEPNNSNKLVKSE